MKRPTLRNGNEKNEKASTSLKLKLQDLSDESSYRITITSDDIEIIAGDEIGFYYGLISLMQLAQTYHQLMQAHAMHKLIIVASNDPQEYQFCSQQLSLSDFKK